MKTWLTADWHLGEDRFELMGRPFTSSLDHIGHLINEHNALVAADDLVYVVGDACYQKSPESLKYVSQFNGKKILIRGNHDKVFTDDQLAPYFTAVVDEGQGVETEVDGIPCYITHYPTEGRVDRFNLVGHIHAAWKYQLNMFNVGIDANHFLPVNIKTIPNHFKAICEFYDEDVWCAYNKINAQYAGKRGKKGRYFNE